MAFLKELRRRSRASFRANSSSGPPAQSGSDATVGTAGKSASATDSSSHSSNNTPPPSLKPSQSSSHLPFTSRSDSWLSPPPQRPVPITSQSNRNSVVVASPLRLSLSFSFESLILYLLTPIFSNIGPQFNRGKRLSEKSCIHISFCSTRCVDLG